MNASEIDAQITEFTEKLDSYISGKLSHSEIRREIDYQLDSFDKIDSWKASKYVKGENAFWAAIWATQHLSDSEHWDQGITVRDLSEIMKYLKGKLDLPDSITGLRPSTNEIQG